MPNCTECGQPFVSDDPEDEICPVCQAEDVPESRFIELQTPDDNSPWRCPECGELMKACVCDEDRFGDEDDFYQDDDDYHEPVGSCEWCGVNLYEDDDPDLCDQCLWSAEQNKGGEDSGIQPVM